MISYVELMVLVVYAAMGGYIMHLQHQLKKAHKEVDIDVDLSAMTAAVVAHKITR